MSDVDRLASALSDRYAIERELGRGGMATVYLARDLKHARPVAIKVLLPEVAAALGHERFLREIEVAARLNHPHILALHDSGEADGQLYYVMPYVNGESLRDRLDHEKQLPFEDVLQISRDVADALDYAHQHGVIHRDIKPENILLGGRHALVADFGIARAVGSAGGANLTTTGMMVGTPLYMSPEQALGDPSVDARSDVYALGCVVYEMLAGQPPFTGPTAEVVRYQHLNAPPPRVTALRPALPPSVAKTLERALAKLPADRFGSAVQLVEALADLDATSPTGAHETIHRRRALILSALMAVAMIAFFAWWKVGFRLPLQSLRASDTAKKGLILVADFEGPPDDPGLAVAARDLIVAALDQSRIVATVPSDQIKIALSDAGRPESTKVNAEVARELAYRRSIPTVLEGRISRLGGGYSTVVRVVNPGDGKAVLAVSEAAHREAELIPCLERVAHKLRSGLGEHKSAVRATRPLIQAMTPSFEAYRKYLKAVELKDDGDFRGAIRLHREALALDPDFAAAWGGLGVAHSNLGSGDDSLTVFYTEALRHRDRLTEAQRFGLESALAALRGDRPLSLSLYDRLLQENITPDQAASVYLNRGFVLAQMGRYDDAVASLARSRPLWSFGPPKNPTLRNMEFSILLTSGRAAAARAVAGQMDGVPRRVAELNLALVAEDWASAEALGTSLASDEDAGRALRMFGTAALASSRAARGAIRSATASLQRAQTLADAAADTEGVATTRWCRLILSVTGVAAAPALPPILNADTLGQGLGAAAMGDTSLARRNLIIGGGYSEEYRSASTLLGGWIAERQGHWDHVVRVFRPELRKIERLGMQGVAENRTLMRWLLADAYERLGRPDSAATSLELVISPPGGYGEPTIASALLSSFAHRRLVLLYARLHRPEEARRHWTSFSRAFVSADPEMLSSIQEARSVVARADDRHAPTRR